MTETMTRNDTRALDGFLQSFKDLEAGWSKNGQGWLQPVRRAAIARLADIGFPTVHDEDWRFTSLAPIVRTAFQPAVGAAASVDAGSLAPFAFAGCDCTRLVFVNGRYEPMLSSFTQLDVEAQVMTFGEALKEAPELLAEHLGTLAPTTQAFTALNTAFMADGVVIRVPKDVTLDTPIHILYLADSHANNASLHPRTLVLAERGARVTLIETFASSGGSSYFSNHVAEVVVGDNARVDHYKVQREGDDAFHVGTTQATQGRDSIYHAFSYATGAQLSRTNVYSKLLGPNAEVRLNGLYALEEAQHADHQTFVEHIAPACSSRAR